MNPNHKNLQMFHEKSVLIFHNMSNATLVQEHHCSLLSQEQFLFLFGKIWHIKMQGTFYIVPQIK